jgi:hypothetical protein
MSELVSIVYKPKGAAGTAASSRVLARRSLARRSGQAVFGRVVSTFSPRGAGKQSFFCMPVSVPGLPVHRLSIACSSTCCATCWDELRRRLRRARAQRAAPAKSGASGQAREGCGRATTFTLPAHGSRRYFPRLFLVPGPLVHRLLRWLVRELAARGAPRGHGLLLAVRCSGDLGGRAAWISRVVGDQTTVREQTPSVLILAAEGKNWNTGVGEAAREEVANGLMRAQWEATPW